MNLPVYKFSTEVEPHLIKFLKVAHENKKLNKNCDMKNYEVWSKLFPLNPNLAEDLDSKEDTVIDLCSDDELFKVPLIPVFESREEIGNSTISDIVFVIKENLETQNDLSQIAKQHLHKCSETDVEKLFEMLGETLNSEEMFHFGVALQTIDSNILIASFCNKCLVPTIRKEYSEKISDLVGQLSAKYSPIVEKECLLIFEKLSDMELIIFLEYMKKLSPQFQSSLARNLILTIRKLDDNLLKIVEVLLNNEVEYEALSKLVDMLSHVAEDHSRNKNFGKLLMNVIEILGPNLVYLELPLKHIIAGHKSVWKSKLEKKFNTCYEDSMLFSQSFKG